MADIIIFISGLVFINSSTLIFYFRIRQNKQAEHYLGLAVVFTAIPILIGLVLNYNDNEIWKSILPLFTIVFCVLEYILDYILKSDFRKTRMLGIYLLFFYLAMFGLIGFSFLANKTYGYVTLISYFINLLLTWYSYSKVGHGH